MSAVVSHQEVDVVSEKLLADMERVAAELLEARAAERRALHIVGVLARRAHKAGMTEVEIARRLGVDRARTFRPMLGK